MSKNVDTAGVEETLRKEKVPKGKLTCWIFLGRTVKSCATVIELMGRYPNI